VSTITVSCIGRSYTPDVGDNDETHPPIVISVLRSVGVGTDSHRPEARGTEPAKTAKLPDTPPPPPTKRLFIADYVISGAVGSALSDAYGNTYGSATAVGRNISLEATDGFMKNCSAVTVTNDRDAADYILRPNKGSSTLYKKNGDVAYVSHAKVKVSNLVKDVCGYIQSHPSQ
jgi:hypothetical protein